MLELSAISAGYGPVQVLFGLSLTVGAGEGVALLGRNGAGKSTTLKAAAGLVPVTDGRVHLEGRDITGWPVHAIARAGLAWVPEDRRVFAGLTVAENIRLGRREGQNPTPEGWSDERLIALFPPLAILWRRRAGHLSGGEQQMVTLARGLAGNPRVLLLDEPAEGLAPLVVEHLATAVAAVKAAGVALLVSEQSLAFAGQVADRAVILDQGRAVWQGSFADLAAAPALAQAHLGV